MKFFGKIICFIAGIKEFVEEVLHIAFFVAVSRFLALEEASSASVCAVLVS